LVLILCAMTPAAWCDGTIAGADPVVLHEDGAWCWFEDERAIIHGDALIVGTVADGRNPDGTRNAGRRGHIEVVTFDLARMQRVGSVVLHSNLQADDHNSPAFMARADGRILAVYAKHGPENHFHYRITTRPGDTMHWEPERTFTPSANSRITYSNLFRLSAENAGRGRIYDFFRGLDNSFKPSYVYSNDGGESWHKGSVVINVPSKVKHRPYAKYASNGTDTVHIVYTEGHPRNYDNSVYHVFYRDGHLHRSDGTVIRPLSQGLVEPEEGTRIFQGDADNVAWTSDIHVDGEGRPYVVYSVQKDSAGLPTGQGGEDHRYRYAWWDGSEWNDHEIAYGGARLYAREDDYTGNVALDPQNLSRVYISTNVDPVSGKPLASGHYEIFEGVTGDGGATWEWQAVTEGSAVDNLRPIVPISRGRDRRRRRHVGVASRHRRFSRGQPAAHCPHQQRSVPGPVVAAGHLQVIHELRPGCSRDRGSAVGAC